MISDLDKTIKNLLLRDMPNDLSSELAISFAAPDSKFTTEANFPAINIFLYDIRENLELRTSERFLNQQINPTATSLQKLPTHVAYSYIITVWNSSQDNPDPATCEHPEHTILGTVLQILLRYPTLPSEILQGRLTNIQPLPRAYVIQSDYLGQRGDYWQSLGGRPKVFINYTVTVPMYAFEPIVDVPLVTDVLAKTKNSFADTAE